MLGFLFFTAACIRLPLLCFLLLSSSSPCCRDGFQNTTKTCALIRRWFHSPSSPSQSSSLQRGQESPAKSAQRTRCLTSGGRQRPAGERQTRMCVYSCSFFPSLNVKNEQHAVTFNPAGAEWDSAAMGCLLAGFFFCFVFFLLSLTEKPRRRPVSSNVFSHSTLPTRLRVKQGQIAQNPQRPRCLRT